MSAYFISRKKFENFKKSNKQVLINEQKISKN